MTTLYGIKNCDTIKKARAWLEQQQIAYQFVDYRTDGLTQAQLANFSAHCGWQNLLNTKGTTYRQLNDADKADLTEDILAGHLFDSLRNKIMPLADDIIVYPAHGAGSACGKNMSSETFDTLGNQKKTN